MTATQIQFRRGSAAQMATFTGAQGEVVVDTTNNRVVVQDGATVGGWPGEIAVRTPVNDANYTAKNTDRIVAYTALTASRTVQLLAAASYPTGTRLLIVDETQSASSSKTITPLCAGLDTVNKAAAAPAAGIVSAAGGSVAIESDGVSNWTVVTPGVASGVSSLGALTGAVGVSYPLGTSGADLVSLAPRAFGRLAYASATQIIFSPYNGDLIRIAGVNYQIQAAGIAAANTSVFVNGTSGQNLAASTFYYVYLFSNFGTLTVNFSTTGHATDITAGNVGTEIESGNNAYSLIGWCYTNASSQFTGSQVNSWFNQAASTPVNFGPLANNTIAGTTSYKMFGYGGSIAYVPIRSGTLIISGNFRSLGTSVSAADGDDYAMYYGTGSAPANGAAVTGTPAFGIQCSTPNGVTNLYPIAGAISGLRIGTPYWFDLAGLLGASSATMQLYGPAFFLLEL